MLSTEGGYHLGGCNEMMIAHDLSFTSRNVRCQHKLCGVAAHNLKLAGSQIVYRFRDMSVRDMSAAVSEEARRMRLLRRAEGFADSVQAFAKRVGWTPNQLTNYESGFRRVPRDAALQLLRVTPGFDPVWLWTGEERGLSFDLRRRIEEAKQAEEREMRGGGPPAAPHERNAS